MKKKNYEGNPEPKREYEKHKYMESLEQQKV